MTTNGSAAGNDADRGEGGFALVMVLVFLLTVTALIAPFALGARTEFMVTSNRMQQDRYELVAEGVLTAVARELAAPPTEPRSPGISVRSSPLICRAGTVAVAITIQDQRGLVGLNTAPKELLEAGFVALEFERADAANLADAVIAYRMTPEAEGERPDVDPKMVVAGLKTAPFEAIEELYDFRGMSRMPAQAIAETFTIHNEQDMIVGQKMSERLSQILPAAPTPRYPFILDGAGDAPRTYRIDVTAANAEMSASAHAGAIVNASEDESGAFEIVERVSNPSFQPDGENGFGAATDCDRLLGVGVAAFLASIP